MMDDADRTLILRAQQGDLEAFSCIVERHWARLVPFARSVVGNGDAEDIVQEGMLIAWKKISRLKDPEAFSAWILRIISRLCFRRARQQRRIAPLDAAMQAEDPAGSLAAEWVVVERVLAVLPARQRAVMHLTLIEGKSDSDIGRALWITAASVRSHRRRARETLRNLLPSRDGEGAGK